LTTSHKVATASDSHHLSHGHAGPTSLTDGIGARGGEGGPRDHKGWVGGGGIETTGGIDTTGGGVHLWRGEFEDGHQNRGGQGGTRSQESVQQRRDLLLEGRGARLEKLRKQKQVDFWVCWGGRVHVCVCVCICMMGGAQMKIK